MSIIVIQLNVALVIDKFNSIQYLIFPVIKHKEYNTHVMSCAPVKEEFTVNYSSECFTMRWDSKKRRAYLVGLP